MNLDGHQSHTDSRGSSNALPVLNRAVASFRWRTTANRLPAAAPGAGQTIEGIQILRAVAALMVVVHHARASVPAAQGWPSYGAAGVDIFFVISGFVMAYTTRRLVFDRAFAGRLEAAGDFLTKRFLRVVPLYWLVLAWTARHDFQAGIFSTGLLKDFLFIPHPNATYVHMLWPSVIQGWTLNYEMFFYALFAASLLFGSTRVAVLIAALLGLTLAGVLLPSAAGLDDIDFPAIARRFYADNILLEFGAGVLLQKFVGRFRPPSWPRSVFLLLMLAGFALLAFGCDRSPRCLWQGLPAVVIVWSAIHAFAGRHLPSWERLAEASYAIYLFHWAAFGVANSLARPLDRAISPHVPQVVGASCLVAVYVAVAVVAGLLIHRLVERPFLEWVRTWLGPRRSPVVP